MLLCFDPPAVHETNHADGRRHIAQLLFESEEPGTIGFNVPKLSIGDIGSSHRPLAGHGVHRSLLDERGQVPSRQMARTVVGLLKPPAGTCKLSCSVAINILTREICRIRIAWRCRSQALLTIFSRWRCVELFIGVDLRLLFAGRQDQCHYKDSPPHPYTPPIGATPDKPTDAAILVRHAIRESAPRYRNGVGSRIRSYFR